MPGKTVYRFGVGGLPSSLAELHHAVAHYDRLGFDFVTKGDHVGGPSPFSLLTAAAAASERLRVRTYVLNASFWNPVLLARAAATLDRLSDGRLELGIGAGTVRSEFTAAGIAFEPAEERVKRMARTISRVRAYLVDPDHQPRPVQQPPPILVGAMSRAGLAVAVDEANIIAFAGVRHRAGHPPGTLRAATAEEADELVAFVRGRAGTRRFESDVLLQAVDLGKDPLAGAKAYIEREGEPEDPRVLAESPCVLFARTAAEAAAEIERRRARWGFTSITTFAPSAEALSAIINELSA